MRSVNAYYTYLADGVTVVSLPVALRQGASNVQAPKAHDRKSGHSVAIVPDRDSWGTLGGNTHGLEGAA